MFASGVPKPLFNEVTATKLGRPIYERIGFGAFMDYDVYVP